LPPSNPMLITDLTIFTCSKSTLKLRRLMPRTKRPVCHSRVKEMSETSKKSKTPSDLIALNIHARE
jgi:hypothetical protein